MIASVTVGGRHMLCRIASFLSSTKRPGLVCRLLGARYVDLQFADLHGIPPSRAGHHVIIIIIIIIMPFRLPQLKSGTVCQRPSSHRHHCRFSAVKLKLVVFNFHTFTWFFDRLTGIVIMVLVVMFVI